MVSAQRRKQLSEARAARQPRIVHGRQPRVKRQELDIATPETPDENKGDSSAAHSTAPSATQNDLYQSEEESYNGAWYWDNSSEDSVSDSDEGEGDNSEYHTEPKLEMDTAIHKISVATQQDSTAQQAPRTAFSMLGWKPGGDKHLRGAWGAGSQSGIERRVRDGKQYQEQASQSYSLKAMVEKNKTVAAEQAQERAQVEERLINISDNAGLARDIPITAACNPPISKRQALYNLRVDALESLTRLLDLVTEQEKKYGYRLGLQSNFYQRHLMVKHFLASQKHQKLRQKRFELAEAVASTFDRGQTTAQNIIHWENSWVDYGKIPRQDDDENSPVWMDDEDLKISIRNFTKKEGQRMY